MRGSRKALNEALQAEPFNAGAVTRALRSMQENLCTSMARSNEAFVALAALLSPQERALLLQTMQNMGHRERRGHDRPPPPASLPDR